MPQDRNEVRGTAPYPPNCAAAAPPAAPDDPSLPPPPLAASFLLATPGDPGPAPAPASAAPPGMPAGDGAAAGRHPPPIRVILLKLVIGVLTPLLLAVAGYGLWNVDLQRRDVDRKIVDRARTVSVAIEHNMLEAQAALSTLALSPHLQAGNMAAFHDQASRAAAPFEGWIVVADADRQQLLNTLKPYGAPLPTGNAGEITGRIFATGQPVISGLFFGRVAERPIIAVSVPVYQEERIAYEMRMAFRTDRFAGLLVGAGLAEAWTAVLFDRDGQIIAQAPAASAAAAGPIAAWFRRGCDSAATGSIDAGPEGALIAACHRSSITGWSTVVAASTRVVDRPITRASLIIVAGALLSLALAVLAALLIGRRIALPLQALASDADAILKGRPGSATAGRLREVENLRSSLLKAADLARRQFETEMVLEREKRAREHAERTRAEIEKRERNIRRLIDSNLIGIVIANEERVVEANDVFLSMVGYSRQALEAGSISWRQMTPPDQQPLGDEVVNELKGRGEIAPFEKEYVRVDGTRLPVLIGAARIDSEPGVLTWVCFVVDLTQQKRAATALRASEERYRGLAEAIASVVWTTAADGSATDMRQWQELTGQTQAEFGGWGWIDAVHPDDQPGTRTAWRHAISSGEPIDVEFRVCTRRGRYRWYNARVVPVRNPGGSIREWVGVGFDIDGRKAAEARQLLLMAELDHRVRNILATVQSMISLTGTGIESKAEYARLLQGRIVAMARAHGLLSRQTWRGATLMQIVHDEIDPYADSGRAFAISGDPDFVLRPKDALDFALVIHELTTNAAKYGALALPGGKVTIDWSVGGAAGDRLIFRWREEGGPPVQPRSRRGFGSRLIENVFNPGAGRASTFTFDPAGLSCVLEMPMTPQPQQLQGAGRPETARGEPTGGRILVVEDELLIAMELHRLLSQAGIDVAGPAATLREALDLARDETLTGAILDINLGASTAYPVAERLADRGVKVAFLTGYAHHTMPERFRHHPLLQKPVDAWLLMQTVRGMQAAAEGPDPREAGPRQAPAAPPGDGAGGGGAGAAARLD